MKKEKEYEEHVKECLTFAQRTADATLGQERQEMRKELQLAIFDKVCTPLYYFLQDGEQGASQPPSEQQVTFANDLGIVNPEQYSKQELSLKIGEALKAKRKNGGGA